MLNAVNLTFVRCLVFWRRRGSTVCLHRDDCSGGRSGGRARDHYFDLPHRESLNVDEVDTLEAVTSDA